MERQKTLEDWVAEQLNCKSYEIHTKNRDNVLNVIFKLSNTTLRAFRNSNGHNYSINDGDIKIDAKIRTHVDYYTPHQITEDYNRAGNMSISLENLVDLTTGNRGNIIMMCDIMYPNVTKEYSKKYYQDKINSTEKLIADYKKKLQELEESVILYKEIISVIQEKNLEILPIEDYKSYIKLIESE